MLPFLINPERAEPNAGKVFQSMMSMSPSSTNVDALVQSLDESDSSANPQPVTGASSNREDPPAITGDPPGQLAAMDTPVDSPFGIQFHPPAAAADFRIQLLRGGDLNDARLSQIQVPTVVVSSARDRLFPSMKEGVAYVSSLPAMPLNASMPIP